MSAILVVELFIGREGKIIQYLIGFHGRIQIIIKVQIAEILTYNGQKYELHTEPLKSHFYEHPIERPGRPHSFCTACWRGYVGHWTIEDDKLYLVH